MKRNEQLLHAIGDVGMDLVELSENHGTFGGRWRRMLPVAACLCIVAGLTLGGVWLLPELMPAEEPPALGAPQPEPVLQSEPLRSDESQQPVAQAESVFEPVVPLYDLSMDYSDGEENSYFAVYRVPQLNYTTEDALAINSAIAGTFGARVKNQLDAPMQEAGPWYSTVNYRQYSHGDLLTLVCYMETTDDRDEYAVYHYDTKNGARLSNEEFLLRMAWDPGIYTELLRQAVQRYALQQALYWNMDPATADEDLSALLWEQYRRTVSPAGLTVECPVYADETGTLHAIVPIYSPLGADPYNRVLTVSEETASWDSAAAGELDYRALVTDLWAGADPHMTLCLADPEGGGVFETVTLPMDWYLERFCVLMDNYTFTRQTEPCPTPGAMWLNLAGNGINWTFWEDGDAGFLVVQDPEEGAVFWKADYRYDTDRDSGWSLPRVIRHEYDGAVVDAGRLSVAGDSASQVLENFCRAYGELLTAQAPGSVYGAAAFDVLSWDPLASGQPKKDGSGAALLGSCKIAVLPELEGYESWLWAGNSVEGQGEYEGWLIFSQQVLLVQQSDGLWKCEEIGTGGLELPS